MERVTQEFPSDVRQLAAVRALVRDELGGTLELDGSAGTRACVRFPA